jgi:RNA polymerase sigma-70 factor, ECF subfamily
MQGIVYCASTRMEEDNAAIARGLRQRDPDLLDRLIELYQHRLYRYLVFFTRESQLADDLFQETWIRVLEKGAQFDPRYKFETWLLRIARNLAIDTLRRRSGPVQWATPEEDDGPFDLADPKPGPSAFDLLAADEARERLAAILDGMPPYYREVLTLRFHEGMSFEEIAGVTGANLSTVKSRLRRGVEMLSTRLEGRSI